MVLPYLYREGKIIKGDSSGLLDRKMSYLDFISTYWGIYSKK